jgi:hypothetical protein
VANHGISRASPRAVSAPRIQVHLMRSDYDHFVGDWEGIASNSNGFDLDVVISLLGPFEVGLACVRSQSQLSCSGVLRLLSIKGDTLQLQAEDKRGPCGEVISDSLQIRPDGSLLYESKGQGSVA